MWTLRIHWSLFVAAILSVIVVGGIIGGTNFLTYTTDECRGSSRVITTHRGVWPPVVTVAEYDAECGIGIGLYEGGEGEQP